MERNKIRTLVVQFNNEISKQEVSYLRGAIIAASGGENILFHNHLEDDQFRYAYPLIQYKRINKRAAIVCIGEGTEAIGEFFQNSDFEVMLGNRPVTLTVESVRANQILVQLWDAQFHYQMRDWLPLNQKNYQIYNKMESLAEQFAFLERILTGNILSFAKSMGIFFETRVTVKITDLKGRINYLKGIPMGGFDVSFTSNITLPNLIGLGQKPSIGKGTVVMIKKNDKNE